MCTQSCPTLCEPMDSSPPGSSVHGILQARILEWVAISYSTFIAYLYINIYIYIYLYTCHILMCAESLQSCPTLCDPTDCSPPGFTVHRILQGRILEWMAMPSSRGSSLPRDRTLISCISCIGKQILDHSCHLGSPS